MNTLQRTNRKSTAALCDPGEVERRYVKRARLVPRHLLLALEEEDPGAIIANVSEDTMAAFLRAHYAQLSHFLAHETLWDKRLLEMGTAIMHREACDRAQKDSAGNKLVDFYITSGLPVSVFVEGSRRRCNSAPFAAIAPDEPRGTGQWESFRTFCGHFLVRHQRAAGIRLEPVVAAPVVDDKATKHLWHELTGTVKMRTALTRGPAAAAQHLLGTSGLLLKKGLRESSVRHLYFLHRSGRGDTFNDCTLHTQLDRRLYELFGPVSTHLGALASIALSYLL